MKTTWTKGLEGQAKEEMVSSFAASGNFRAKLIELLQDKIRVNDKERISKEGYANPNWAFKQADASGFQRALEEVISLLE